MPTTCGFTPLHFASLARKSEAIQQLLEYGANPAALTTLDGVHEGLLCAKWSTPLHVSAKQGEHIAHPMHKTPWPIQDKLEHSRTRLFTSKCAGVVCRAL